MPSLVPKGFQTPLYGLWSEFLAILGPKTGPRTAIFARFSKSARSGQQPNNSTNQQLNNPTTQEPNYPTTQQLNNPTSQPPKTQPSNNPTTQQPNKPTPHQPTQQRNLTAPQPNGPIMGRRAREAFTIFTLLVFWILILYYQF